MVDPRPLPDPLAAFFEPVCLDQEHCLWLAAAVPDWHHTVQRYGFDMVIDLEGGLDHGIPTTPGRILYVYCPIYDEALPDLERVHGVARLGASMVAAGRKVLSHCEMGLNRSALMAGLILVHLGMTGVEAIELIKRQRPGAFDNDRFEQYLASLGAMDG
jgi:Dual specificity phosphatase, catalytic domain